MNPPAAANGLRGESNGARVTQLARSNSGAQVVTDGSRFAERVQVLSAFGAVRGEKGRHIAERCAQDQWPVHAAVGSCQSALGQRVDGTSGGYAVLHLQNRWQLSANATRLEREVSGARVVCVCMVR
jgi:hypothetical protein